MPFTVKHLNADSTFLVSFTPSFTPSDADADFPGSFTILIDPWLSGHSSVWKPSFQISHHTSAPCVQSLTDIRLPDLIIISQDKPDHCHRETLCTLPHDTRIRILATPAAAKKIKSWKHFTNATIEFLVPYSPEKSDSLVRILLQNYNSRSEPGEMTISYLPQKMDLTALHNAIGITYRSPGTTTITNSGTIVDLPVSPPVSPASSRTQTPHAQRSVESVNANHSYMTPPASPTDEQHPGSALPGPSQRTLSVLYSPHGVSYSAIAPYAASHLKKESALPLTALFHSINTEENPWFMGGVVAAGYPGGEKIVRELGAEYWISAHDEVKDNQGWSVTWIKSTAYTVEAAQRKLDQVLGQTFSSSSASKKADDETTRTKIASMESGESLFIT
ncbi:hypothetical protein AAFC00_006702 [Neodothiora populina]|uniref:Metallo-beta-lactamase domain-containing protein n=1 Tax=Neodothiora populina TaxID=2781224 RepID=A0ABR3PAW5_9PEZI